MSDNAERHPISGRRAMVCYQCGKESMRRTETSYVCNECDSFVSVDRARIAFRRQHKQIRHLARHGPAISGEPPFEYGVRDTIRDSIRRLKKPATSTAATGRPPTNADVVLYLPGDERRAVDVFVEQNTEYVADCLEDKNNPLVMSWSEELCRVVTEQFEWGHAPADTRSTSENSAGTDR